MSPAGPTPPSLRPLRMRRSGWSTTTSCRPCRTKRTRTARRCLRARSSLARANPRSLSRSILRSWRGSSSPARSQTTTYCSASMINSAYRSTDSRGKICCCRGVATTTYICTDSRSRRPRKTAASIPTTWLNIRRPSIKLRYRTVKSLCLR